MRNVYKLCILFFCVFVSCSMLVAQNNFFNDQGANRAMPTTGERIIKPEKYRTLTANVNELRDFLWSLPEESTVLANRNLAPVLSLPMPDGSMARFRVWESSVQAPELAAKFPEIKTFLGQGIDDPAATVRFNYDPYFGFGAQILSPNGRVYIDAYARWDINNYISYYQRDNVRRSSFACSVDEVVNRTESTNAGPCLGTSLRTYRLAVSCTGEYAVAVGGGLAGPTHAAIVTSTNRITGVYENELAIRLVLIANNNLIEYLNGATDPFTNVISTTLLNQNQTNTDAVIGFANYDIGHIFTSDDNGLAQLNAVCGSGKARGATGALVLVGDGFDIDFVAHEMGHQFGANHTFNSASCASPGGSFEPGGGTTIMAYAGICASSENIQPNSDAIFHAISFDQISTYITSGGGAACPVSTPTGNTLPVIIPLENNNLSIPINTPFTLNALASDADGDAITYNWEGWDIGPAGTWPSASTSTTRPLFRTRTSKPSGSRTFPDIRVIVANYPGTGAPSAMDGLRGEVLPEVERIMKFRLTVRDNRAGGAGVVSSGEGCQGSATFMLNVVGSTPFTVTAPNSGGSWAVGCDLPITWNVAGTNTAPFNVPNVKISLSIDGGLTYPTVLVASTPNDGSHTVQVPSVTPTTLARVKVEAIGNVFFDISNNDFTITAGTGGFSFNPVSPVVISCPAPATMTASLTAAYVAPYTGNIALSATGAPTGTTVSFGTNPLTPGTPTTTVNLNNANTLSPGTYTITVTGTGTGTCVPSQSRDIVFTISGSVPSITGQPVNRLICAGSGTTFSGSATNGVSSQWQVSTDAGANWSNVTNSAIYSGAGTNTLTITGATASMNDYRYRLVVTGTCPPPAISSAATLNVVAPVVVNTQPTDKLICSGSVTTFSVAATSTETIGYQWQVSTDGGANWNNVINNATYNGAQTANLVITDATVALNNNQYRVLTNNVTCPTTSPSNAAVLRVRQLPTVGLTASSLSLLPGQTATLTATPSAPVAGGTQTFNWMFNGAPAVPAITGTSVVVDVNDLGTYQVVIQESYTAPNLVCTNQSTAITISATASTRLFIFPSPNDGRFTVSYYNNGGASTSRNINIYDSKGSRVFSRKFPISGLYTLIDLDLTTASRGIYYVVVGDATGKKLAEGKVHIR